MKAPRERAVRRPSGSAPRLYLIRHGETAWARAGRHTGRTDVPLTPRGEGEVRDLGAHLRSIAFAHVLTSPLQRARRTGELAGLAVPSRDEPDLIEWDHGDYEGRTLDDIRIRHPDWCVFRDGCPHGESPVQVAARADRLIARLRRLRGNVALFSHGHLGAALAARWIGLPLAAARHFPLATAALSILAHDPHRPADPVIALWNAAPRAEP